VQKPVAGEVRSILHRVQHPRVPPAAAAHRLRRPAAPIFRPATRASARVDAPEPSSGSGLTDAQRAAVPTIAPARLPAPAPILAPAAPPAAVVGPAPAPKAVARRPPPPILLVARGVLIATDSRLEAKKYLGR
jgi:hypothetical protein